MKFMITEITIVTILIFEIDIAGSILTAGE